MSDPSLPVGGPGSGPVRLVEASPAWLLTAERECDRLARALGGILLQIHHIGSTAIPGIRAKPIVDLLPVVSGVVELDAERQRVEACGYFWWGEYGITGRRYCTLQDPLTQTRAVNAHFFAHGDPHIERHIAFRDFLRANAPAAAEYERVKTRAAMLHPEDVNAYNDAKSGWIRSIERPAIAWHRSRR